MEWGILHTTSSPRYPQSNGFIERQVRYIKPIIKKCLRSNADVNIALMNIRATPLDAALPSPAELMFKRPITTILPSRAKELAPEVYRDHIRLCQHNQKAYADQHTKELPPLLTGQTVRVLDKERKQWFLGKVVARNRDRSYQILTEGGSALIRNRSHLRVIPPPVPTATQPEMPAHKDSAGPAENAPTSTTPPAAVMRPQTPPKSTPLTRRSGRTTSKPSRLIEEM